MVLPNFSKEDNSLLVESGHRLVPFLLVENEKSKGTQDIDATGHWKLVYRYPTLLVQTDEHSIQIPSRLTSDQSTIHFWPIYVHAPQWPESM